MRVIVDAHLPKRLAELFVVHGINSKHTLDLPEQNATADSEIIRLADKENRIVISKDRDFLDNHILDGRPKKLLIVTTGNINNRNLMQLFEKNLETLRLLFLEYVVVEIDEENIRVHY